MAAHEGLHEKESELQPETLEMHRAIVSLIEELEAVDWYQQRVDDGAGVDPPQLKEYLFTDKPLAHD